MENPGASEHYTATQTKVFTNWVNIKLKGSGQTVVELRTDFCDGVRLIKLLEILARRGIGKKYKENYPTMKFMRLDNMTAAFDFLKREAVRLENIGPEDIVDGNLKLILGLIWTLIRRYDIDSITFEGDDGSGGINPLLAWAQKRTKGYPNCNVTNLDTSFQDGMAFNALLHSYYPAGIDYDNMSPENARDNLNHAFDAAEKYWGIPRMLDPEDLVNQKPDDKSVQTYLAAMYQGLQKPPKVPDEELAEMRRQKELAEQAERDRLAELARQQREAEEAERRRKEEEARLAALEAERLRQEELERQRQEEAERLRKEAEEAERKRKEEEERKRKEAEEAERLRLAELERQRLEAERLAREEQERQERLAREKEQMESRGDLAIGEWTGDEAGGAPNHETFRNNPMFELTVTEDTPLLVTLKSDAPDANNTRMGFYVVRPTDPTGITLPLDNGAIAAKVDPVKSNEVSAEMHLAPAEEPYIVIPYTDNPNENGHFSLKAVPTTLGNAVVKLQPKGIPDPYKTKQAVAGEWTEAMSGGMYDLPTWRENPQFMIKCSRPTKLKIFLTQPYDPATGTSANSISFNIVRNIDDNETEYVLVANDVLKQVTRLLPNGKVVHYSNDKAEVSMDYDVDFGEGPYPPIFVVPSCWTANTVGKFLVTVYSDQEDTEVRFVGGLNNFPHITELSGSWQGESAGGNRTCDTWRNNPQYKITCSCPTKMSILLARTKNEIVTEDGISFLANKQIGISFHVVRNKDPNFTDSVLPSCEVLGTPKQYEQRAEVALNITLDSRPAFIVPSTYNPGQELDFSLTCYTEFPVTITPVSQSAGSNITLEGEWKGKTAGGSSNKPTWRDNPNFRLTVNNNNTLVSVILKQEIASGAKPKGVACHLVKNKDARFRSKLLPSFDNVTETRNGDYVYMARPEVSFEASLNEGTYFIVPSTFNGGAAEEGKFSLSIITNQKVTCEDARSATLAYETSIRGEWKGPTAGGNANEATWKNNPRFRLTVANKGLVAVAIAQDVPAGGQPKGIGFQIMNDQGNGLVHRFSYEGNYAYVPKPEISSEVVLEKGSYVVVPSTFNKGEEAKFTVSAMSEETPVQLANIAGAISNVTNVTPTSTAHRPAAASPSPARTPTSPAASPARTPTSPAASSPAARSPAAAAASTPKKVTLEDLEALASLRDKGIITEEEFQAKKREALGI